MTCFPFTIVGFDLDGTLVDTAGDLTRAVNRMLAELGRPARTRAEVVATIGGGAHAMVRQTLEETGGCPADPDAAFRRFMDHYARDLARESRSYPGVSEALDALAERGVRLAVATNKPEALAERLLQALLLRDRFAVVIGGDTLGPGRAKPRRDPIDAMVARCGGGAAAFVGDSVYDIDAARAAGVPVVALTLGYGGDAIRTRGAGALVDRWADVVPALERLGSGG